MIRATDKRLARLEALAFPPQWLPCHCLLGCSEEEAEAKRADMLASGKAAAGDDFMTILLVPGTGEAT